MALYSLQDICLLNIVFRVNEFPVEYLALLPRAIRQRLFDRLPLVDVLHISNTCLFSDLDELELQEKLITAKEDLMRVIMEANAFSLRNIVSFRDCRPRFRLSAAFGESFPSFEAMVYTDYCCCKVVPKHLKQFAGLIQYDRCGCYCVKCPPELAWTLLHYCNMHCALPSLTINCCNFRKTMFWESYTAQESASLAIPFIREFLSSVETLNLILMSDGKVPYIILYNIFSSNQLHLKHIGIEGHLYNMKCTLEEIVELFCVREETKLKTNQLEGISIIIWPYNSDSTFKYYAQHIALITQSLILNTIQTLHSVTIRGLGFCYNDVSIAETESQFMEEESSGLHNRIYAPVLFSSLHQFLKQPQFKELSIDKTPFSASCELIMIFLTTPTSHEQTLCIEAEEENGEIHYSKVDNGIECSKVNESRKRNNALESSDVPPSKVVKQSFPNLHLPETNAQYKCLNLGLSCSGLHSWLFTLPELKLKKLGLHAQHVPLVPQEMIIQAEHVAFMNSPAKTYTPTTCISSAHLEKFIIFNPSLKRLEFTTPITPGLLPALNHCLSVINQQGRELEEIVLKLVELHTDNDMKEFFILVRDLSHNNGTTLVITLEDTCTDYELDQYELSSCFHERKIKKIILTGAQKDFWLFKQLRDCYELLTDELVVHHM